MRADVAAMAAVLAGCPLPQPVSSFTQEASITPPRIVQDASLTPAETQIPFHSPCPVGSRQTFTVTATVADDNAGEPVDYRWFVDYDRLDSSRYQPLGDSGRLDPPVQPPFTRRPVPPLSFVPGDYGEAIHVLELVLSNGFEGAPPDQPSLPLPWRTPSPNYEVQAYRWVFVPVPGTCP